MEIFDFLRENNEQILRKGKKCEEMKNLMKEIHVRGKIRHTQMRKREEFWIFNKINEGKTEEIKIWVKESDQNVKKWRKNEEQYHEYYGESWSLSSCNLHSEWRLATNMSAKF